MYAKMPPTTCQSPRGDQVSASIIQPNRSRIAPSSQDVTSVVFSMQATQILGLALVASLITPALPSTRCQHPHRRRCPRREGPRVTRLVGAAWTDVTRSPFEDAASPAFFPEMRNECRRLSGKPSSRIARGDSGRSTREAEQIRESTFTSWTDPRKSTPQRHNLLGDRVRASVALPPHGHAGAEAVLTPDIWPLKGLGGEPASGKARAQDGRLLRTEHHPQQTQKQQKSYGRNNRGAQTKQTREDNPAGTVPAGGTAREGMHPRGSPRTSTKWDRPMLVGNPVGSPARKAPIGAGIDHALGRRSNRPAPQSQRPISLTLGGRGAPHQKAQTPARAVAAAGAGAGHHGRGRHLGAAETRGIKTRCFSSLTPAARTTTPNRGPREHIVVACCPSSKKFWGFLAGFAVFGNRNDVTAWCRIAQVLSITVSRMFGTPCYVYGRSSSAALLARANEAAKAVQNLTIHWASVRQGAAGQEVDYLGLSVSPEGGYRRPHSGKIKGSPTRWSTTR